MESMSLNKVVDIREDEAGMYVLMTTGATVPISFWFMHASELKFIRRGQ